MPAATGVGPDTGRLDLEMPIYPEVIPGSGFEQIEGLYEAKNAGWAMPP